MSSALLRAWRRLATLLATSSASARTIAANPATANRLSNMATHFVPGIGRVFLVRNRQTDRSSRTAGGLSEEEVHHAYWRLILALTPLRSKQNIRKIVLLFRVVPQPPVR